MKDPTSVIIDVGYANDRRDGQHAKTFLALLQAEYPKGAAFTDSVRNEYAALETVLKYWCLKAQVIWIRTDGTCKNNLIKEVVISLAKRRIPGLNEMTKFLYTAGGGKVPLVCGIYEDTILVNIPQKYEEAEKYFKFMQIVLRGFDFPEKYPDFESQVSLRYHIAPSSTMISVDEATKIISDSLQLLDDELVEVKQAYGRVLAEDVLSVTNFPEYRIAKISGFALSTSLTYKQRLTIVECTSEDDIKLDKANHTTWVYKGDTLHDTIGSVVPVEGVEYVCNGSCIELNSKPRTGLNIVDIGSIHAAGSKVYECGETLNFEQIQQLDLVGVTQVLVRSRPRIGLLSTIHEPNMIPSAEVISDPNYAALALLLKSYGHDPECYLVASDYPDDIAGSLSRAMQDSDVIVTTGGISADDLSILKEILVQDFEATILFSGVKMKPGKSMTFATLVFQGRRKWVFALPKRPSTAKASCLLFVIPALARLERKSFEHPTIHVVLGTFFERNCFPQYLRANLRYNGVANDVLVVEDSTKPANSLVVVPPVSAGFKQYPYKVMVFNRDL